MCENRAGEKVMKKGNCNEIKVLCKNLRELRKALGLSVKSMAKRLHISAQTLLSLENEKLPPKLSVSFLFRIEEEFGISPKDMFLEKPEKYFDFFPKTP